MSEQVLERDRCAAVLREIELEPLPSRANFIFVPIEDSHGVGTALLREGLVVRVFPDGIRFSVRDREDDDRLLDALATL